MSIIVLCSWLNPKDGGQKNYMYNITFQQIEAFLAVANYLNLSKAADAMFITQSALSKTLQRFEEGVELQLFTRSNQGLALTDEGKYLYSNLETLYTSMNKTIKTAQSIRSMKSKTLRIVAPSSYDAAEDFDRLKTFVRQYHNKYPDVTLMETLFDFRQLRQTLEFGDADLVFTQDFSVIDLPGISFKRISKFERFVAMSSEHPLASRDTLDYTELSDEIFYTVPIPKDLTNLNETIEQCKRLGFTPKALEFVPNFQTLLHNIKEGRGIGLCGRYSYLGYADIKYFPLPESEKYSHVIVAWRTDKISSEAQNFIKLLTDTPE